MVVFSVKFPVWSYTVLVLTDLHSEEPLEFSPVVRFELSFKGFFKLHYVFVTCSNQVMDPIRIV